MDKSSSQHAAIPQGASGNYEYYFEPSPRRIRAVFNGEVVADSKRMMLMRENRSVPVYYFPRPDVNMSLLKSSSQTSDGGEKGRSEFWNLEVGGKRADNAAFTFAGPSPAGPNLDGYLTFEWGLMDSWLEEDEEIFVHARDPYKRIDIAASSRNIKVVMDDAVLAETERPTILFETGMPTRYYIPRGDVNMEYLESSKKITGCPYKGQASYYGIRIGERLYQDHVWFYKFPVPNCSKIEGLLCFFNEKLDIYDDGELLPRPRTPWS